MPVFNPRNRLVNFRLSDEEFERLRASSAVSGARSLSDFARSAVMRCAAETGPVQSNTARFDLDSKVLELEGRVSELVGLIEALKRHDSGSLTAGTQADAAQMNAGER